jgi:hypothetical protein
MKKTLMTAALLALMACTASAAGLNLAWTDCLGNGGAANNSFACTTNAGSQVLFGSYDPPAGLLEVNGNEMVLDLQTDQTTLSPWWTMGSTGCAGRTGTPTSNFDFTTNTGNCVDYWAGNAAGGINYTPQFSGAPNRARIQLVCAIAEALAAPQDAGTEYYSFKATISNARTVGLGSCAGCTDAACIVLNSIKITQNITQTLNPTLTNAALANAVTWRGGLSPDCQVTPARNRTWGSVKALYR